MQPGPKNIKIQRRSSPTTESDVELWVRITWWEINAEDGQDKTSRCPHKSTR